VAALSQSLDDVLVFLCTYYLPLDLVKIRITARTRWTRASRCQRSSRSPRNLTSAAAPSPSCAAVYVSSPPLIWFYLAAENQTYIIL
jgi:hypothetical protein